MGKRSRNSAAVPLKEISAASPCAASRRLSSSKAEAAEPRESSTTWSARFTACRWCVQSTMELLESSGLWNLSKEKEKENGRSYRNCMEL